ncbi:ATP-binding protein [Hymenobacter bucti]|uniref:ATP-binding protein n=1 Tax=Hymenobacter bucti TaxID=1844114 RepID=A0ABW4QT51_9BACT
MEIVNPTLGETLAAELDWLAAVLEARFNLHFGLGDAVAALSKKALPAPDLHQATNAYAEHTRHLSWPERLVLALALAPHLRPQALDLFFTRNSAYDRPFTEFGGLKGKHHPGFLPSGETALFVLAGSDLARRQRYQARLWSSSRLAKARLVQLEAAEPGEPALSGALTVPPEALAHLTTGKRLRPQYRADFPAQRISTPLKWADLVLDHPVLEQLAELKTWLRHQDEILQHPHLRRHLKPGYRALFYGPPGTGKTLTACLLGKSTRPRHQVYRVDSSMLVSKYIGETEKNLAHVFDTAERRRWILFFDEADALFGKRSTGSTANDRHANQEVAYLLQRIEDFPGVIILASNLKGNLDEAFARRFQAMVRFPLPGPAERLRLWQAAFAPSPEAAPEATFSLAADVQFEELAEKYQLTGGAILNVLRYCVLLGLRHRRPITLGELQLGIQRELAKEGKTT